MNISRYGTPICVLQLEDRIQSNITLSVDGRLYLVESKSYSHKGEGVTPLAACRNFLYRNRLESEE